MWRECSHLTPYAQKLRKSMTAEELILWTRFLKHLPMTVHRQKTIGPYIVDFYIASKKFVIEIDGSQHYDEEGKKTDEARDRFLAERGVTVLRYSNLDIRKNFNGVCEELLDRLGLDTIDFNK